MRREAKVWCLAILPLTFPGMASAEPSIVEHADDSLSDEVAHTESGASPGGNLRERSLRVAVSRASDLVGRPMYADRSTVGTSATQVSFSDRPVVSVIDTGATLVGSLPLRGARLSSRFGYRLDPLAGDWRLHSGVDLAAPFGTPVLATQAGIVRYAAWRGGYGLLVELEHSGGLETRYGHLSRINVRAGEAIGAGEVLGYVGSTGNSTGPHLHYETRLNGRAYDPITR